MSTPAVKPPVATLAVLALDLDEQWIEDLLITAFDPQYGGCNYWIVADDAILQTRVVPRDDAPESWAGVELTVDPEEDLTDWKVEWLPGWRCVIGGADLGRAWVHIVNERPIRSDLVQQFLTSQTEGDLDVDADAADCLVQYALFGQVIYG